MKRNCEFALLLAATVGITSWCRAEERKPQPLPRRAALGGMAFAPRQGGVGVEIRAVPADSPGQAAGVQVGDVLLAIDGASIAQIPQLLAVLKQHKAGDEATLKLERAGTPLEKKIKLTATPRETSSEFDVIYDSFAVGKARLSAIVTKPRGTGRFPAVIFVPGLACISYDLPNGDLFGIKGMMYELTRSGYVTMRPEKSGMGDSEGPACEDTDFLTETAGFEQALRLLESYDFVDKEKVFLVGHSMGGIEAPLVLNRVGGVRGALVYGTTGRTWIEYMIENSRRDSIVGGADPVEVEQQMRTVESFFFEAYINHRSGKDLRAMNPKFAEVIDPNDRVSGRTNVFFQQIQDTDLAKEWSKFPGDVLAVWGKSDFVTGPADHEAIAQAVNHSHPGHAEFRALEGVDHFFDQAVSQEDSFKQFSQRNFKPFNPIIQETVRAWLNQQIHATPVAVPAAQAAIEGNWQGSISAGGQSLRIVVHIEHGKDSSLFAKMDSPDQNVTGMAIDRIEYHEPALHFEMSQIGGVYDGALDKAKSEIAGHWKQGGQDMELNLKRVP